MICPECKEQGLKSCVYPGQRFITAMGSEEYYDEDGKHHRHDPNIMKTRYSCTNGHGWGEEETGSCWCGWPEKK